jgi:Spy/CpxP family protein refolding chaperone
VEQWNTKCLSRHGGTPFPQLNLTHQQSFTAFVALQTNEREMDEES